ncbi:ATP-binding protein [Paenibacillus alba]|uniref:ATP-binding protein n=1 Tax=Paenibacillus alba TaxID=1197127 RepID=UPI0015666C6D|nr:ATP-binding protein [Paenibacillus alba]NQX71813.1 ATP-binding protein [Paenibacillus alba]
MISIEPLDDVVDYTPVLLGRTIKADYKEQPIWAYKWNPFIEALPPIFEYQQVTKRIRNYPDYQDEQRKLGKSIRLHLVQQLVDYVEPLPEHILIEQRISRMLRHGYRARNPLFRKYTKQFTIGFDELLEQGVDEKGRNKAGIRPTAAGFAIIGCSGLGKTTSIESTLLLYPQVIEHSNYRSRPLPVKQITWLKLNCPFDGSTKGLCINFFQAVDAVLGTSRYFKKYVSKGATQDILIPHMAQIATLHGLGVLVIDEIQNLSLLKSGGAEKMLNFFTQLVNTIGVPIVLLGTFKAIKLFSGSFSQARRNSGQGDLIMDRIPNGEKWNFFIQKLWKYQWTSTLTEYDQSFAKLLYELSQGIIDIAVKLYMLAQWEVIADIRNKNEIITKKVLNDVAKNHLRLVRPMLQALKSGNMELVKKYEDLYPKWNDLDEVLKQATEKLIITGKMKEGVIRDDKVYTDEDLYIELVKTAIQFGATSDQAEQIVTYVIKKYGVDCGKIALRKQIVYLLEKPNPMEDILNSESASISDSVITEQKSCASFREPEDLRNSAPNRSTSSETIYESVQKTGAIPNQDELFQEINAKNE